MEEDLVTANSSTYSSAHTSVGYSCIGRCGLIHPNNCYVEAGVTQGSRRRIRYQRTIIIVENATGVPHSTVNTFIIPWVPKQLGTFTADDMLETIK